MTSRRSWWRDNGLGLVFAALFLLVLAGQALSGLALYNDEARAARLQTLDLPAYVSSSAFAVDVAENWQSEFLQFLLFIWLTVWLVQRGSPESKPVDAAGPGSEEDARVGRFAPDDAPAWVRAGGWRARVYGHSLTLTMGLVFVLSWAAQGLAGRVALNEERLRDLRPPLSTGAYLTSPDFWSRTLQNWQSELLAVGTMAVFTIYLRERGSPESKPVGAPHDSHG